jgi:hypothetical protein
LSSATRNAHETQGGEKSTKSDGDIGQAFLRRPEEDFWSISGSSKTIWPNIK